MQLEVIGEYGYEQALLGMGLSFGLTSGHYLPELFAEDNWIGYDKIPQRLVTVADKLKEKDYGENKFLEHIQVWLDWKTARYHWQEIDTYRVGTSKLSESTMHTLLKRKLKPEDFEGGLEEEILNLINKYIGEKNFLKAKTILPESFLQRRIVSTNYKTLRNMIIQRKNHKLQLWKDTITILSKKLKHPELLPF